MILEIVDLVMGDLMIEHRQRQKPNVPYNS